MLVFINLYMNLYLYLSKSPEIVYNYEYLTLPPLGPLFIFEILAIIFHLGEAVGDLIYEVFLVAGEAGVD